MNVQLAVDFAVWYVALWVLVESTKALCSKLWRLLCAQDDVDQEKLP